MGLLLRAHGYASHDDPGATLNRSLAWVLATATAGAIAASACGDGDAGAPGPAGPDGGAGEAGASASLVLPEAGATALGPGCTSACHTLGGVVDQWRGSAHQHPQENVIGAGACGNCHGIDGIEHRLANEYVVPADAGAAVDVPKGHVEYTSSKGVLSEVGYGGTTTTGQVHCTTCHDWNPTNDPHVTGRYVTGQTPLRVPGGVDDTVLFEKTDGIAPTQSLGQPVSYAAANVCVFCHKSRKDVSLYITPTGNALSSIRWGPHDGPQTDVYSGKGGYHFAGVAYGTSTHSSLVNACVDCHMVPLATNGNIPDHSMRPPVAFCKTCHAAHAGSTFDIQGGQTTVRNLLRELQQALNARGWLTRSAVTPFAPLQSVELADDRFSLDTVLPTATLVVGPDAGAVYDYFLVARSKDLGVHNPTYVKQLLWDSIRQITAAAPTSLPTRPQ